MNNYVLYIIFCILSFFLGSIPSGLLLGKLIGKDLRQSGSGNIGTTNAFRTLGKGLGALTFLGDTLKGIPFMLLGQAYQMDLSQLAMIGFFAFLGHCFSPYLKFRGGKGVATAFAIFCFLSPTSSVHALIAFLLVFFSTGIISLSSLSATLALNISIFLNYPDKILFLLGISVSSVIWIKHIDNIKRLQNGTENKFNVGLRKIRGS